MKKYLDHPIISLAHEKYLSLLIVLASALYFLSGINLDLYSPSMPIIADYFHATMVQTKNTMSASLLGWAIGAFVFGILVDTYGRKKILIFGMFFYVISSIFAPFSQNIHELIVIRFIQNFCIASILGSRILIIDNFSGRRYTIAMLYTTIGYGLGPIVGPFVGGLLQYYFNWQACFIALILIGFIILVVLFLFVKESNAIKHPLKFKSTMTRCFSVLSHKKFMAGVVIAGITQVQLMLYPTLGPFIVEKTLHQSVLVYGNSALMVGASYLTGSLFNRLLLKYLLPIKICDIGFIILILSVLISFLFSFDMPLELSTVMVPIFLMGVSVGFIFPNVLGMNLKQFSHTAGAAMAVQSSTLLMLASFGIFLVSHVHVERLFQLSIILLILAALEFLVFFLFYRDMFLSE